MENKSNVFKKIIYITFSIIFMVFISVVIFFNTPYGKKKLENYLEKKLYDSYGIVLDIKNFHGDYIRNIYIENISFEYKISDKYFITIKVPEISVKFWLWEILQKKIGIDAIIFNSPNILLKLDNNSISNSQALKNNPQGNFSNNYLIDIKRIFISNGKINVYKNNEELLSSLIKEGDFKVVYSNEYNKKTKVKITSFSMYIDAFNQNVLKEFLTLDQIKNINFKGKMHVFLKGDLDDLNITSEIALSNILLEKYNIENFNAFLICQYYKKSEVGSQKSEEILEIKNMGIETDGSRLELVGEIFPGKPDIEYNLNLKILHLNLEKQKSEFVKNLKFLSPLEFILKGKGLSLENINAEGKCKFENIEIIPGLKIENILANYRLNRDGLFLDKAIINSNFGEGEITGKLINYNRIQLDFLMNNLVSKKEIFFDTTRSLKGEYTLQCNLGGALDSTNCVAKFEVKNFTLDSTRIDYMLSELSWSGFKKTWSIDVQSNGLKYDNLSSKNIALHIEKDSTLDSSYVMAFKFLKNKFPESDVDRISGKLKYKDKKIELQKVRFEQNKNVAFLNGEFFVNPKEKVIDKNNPWLLNLNINNMNLEIFKPFLPGINKLSGKAVGSIFIKGTPKKPKISGDFKVSNGELDYPQALKQPINIDVIQASIKYTNENINIKNILIKKNKSEIFFSGVIPWDSVKNKFDHNGDIQGKINFTELDLDEIKPYLPKEFNYIKGKTSLNLNIGGKMSSPTIKANLEIKSVKFSQNIKDEIKNIEFDKISGNFLYKNDELQINKMRFEKNKKNIEINGLLPIKSKKLKIDKEKDINLSLSSIDFNFEDLIQLIPLPIKTAIGSANLNLKISGQFENLQFDGNLGLNECNVFCEKPKLDVERITAKFLFVKNKIKIEKISGLFNKNYLDLSGELDFQDKKRILKISKFIGSVKNIDFINSNSNAQIDLTENEPIKISNLSFSLVQGGKIKLDGIISQDKSLGLTLNLSDVNLVILKKAFDSTLNFEGTMQSQTKINGNIEKPEINSKFWIYNGITKEINYDKIIGDINFLDEKIKINSLIFQKKFELLAITGFLPLENKDEKISISFEKQSNIKIKAKNFNFLFLSKISKNIKECKSDIDLDLNIDGSLSKAKINGLMDMRDFSMVFGEKNDLLSIKNFKGEWKESRAMLLGVKIKYNDLDLILSGEAHLQNKELDFNFLKFDGKYQEHSFTNLSRFALNVNDKNLTLKESKFLFNEGEIELWGNYCWDGKYNFEVSLDKFELHTLSYIAKFNENVRGKIKVNGIFKSNIKGEKQFDLNIAIEDGKYKNIVIGDILAKVITGKGKIAIAPIIIRSGSTISKIDGIFSLPDSNQETFSCKGNLRGIDIKLLELFTQNIKELNGKVNVSFDAKGTYSSPNMDGFVEIENGEFLLPAMKKRFSKIDTKLKLHKNKIIFNEVKANIGDGVITLDGEVNLGKEIKEILGLKVSINKWFFTGLPDLKATINGEMQVRGNLKNIKVTGTFTALDAQYTREFEEKSIVESLIDRAIEESQTDVEYDLEIILPKNAWVTNKTVKAEVTGTLFYRQNDKGKFFTGKLSVLQGNYNFYTKDLEIITEPDYDSYLEFVPDEDKVTPKFHFLARFIRKYKGEDKVIEVTLKGMIDDPNILNYYSKDGSIKKDDIIPFVTYGKIMSDNQTQDQNTPEYQALVLGTLADQLLFSSLERKFELDFGFDIVQFQTGVSEKGEYEFQGIKLAKYIAPNLFVTYNQPTTTTGTKKIEAEYQINKYFSISTEVDDKGTKNLDVKFKFRYWGD